MDFGNAFDRAVQNQRDEQRRLAELRAKQAESERYMAPIRRQNFLEFRSKMRQHEIAPLPIIKVDRRHYSDTGQVQELGCVGYGWAVIESHSSWSDYVRGVAILDSDLTTEVEIDYLPQGDSSLGVHFPYIHFDLYKQGSYLYTIQNPVESKRFGPRPLSSIRFYYEGEDRWVNTGAHELAEVAVRLINKG